MTCSTCNNCQKKITFLGFRLRCKRYKRTVNALDSCIDLMVKRG